MWHCYFPTYSTTTSSICPYIWFKILSFLQLCKCIFYCYFSNCLDHDLFGICRCNKHEYTTTTCALWKKLVQTSTFLFCIKKNSFAVLIIIITMISFQFLFCVSWSKRKQTKTIIHVVNRLQPNCAVLSLFFAYKKSEALAHEN